MFAVIRAAIEQGPKRGRPRPGSPLPPCTVWALCIVTARSFTLCWTRWLQLATGTGMGTGTDCGTGGDLSSLRGLLGWFGHWHADFCSRQNCRQIVYTGMKLCWGQAEDSRQPTTTGQGMLLFLLRLLPLPLLLVAAVVVAGMRIAQSSCKQNIWIKWLSAACNKKQQQLQQAKRIENAIKWQQLSKQDEKRIERYVQ